MASSDLGTNPYVAPEGVTNETPPEALEVPDTAPYQVAWEQTELYRRWHKRVATGYANDFFVVVTPSSHTGVSGTGKTTLEANLLESFDISEQFGGSGFDAESQTTVDPGDLPKILREAEEGSAIGVDEAQGTPETTGFDKRRGMKDETIKAINSILANRDMRVSIVLVAQQLGMLDARLLPLIDAWLLITKEPDDPDGPVCVHHMLTTNDYEIKSPSIKTPALEELTWPRRPHDDPIYSVLERKKQAAKGYERDDSEEDRDLPDDIQAELAQEYRNMGKSLLWIEENVDRITYSREWIRLNTETPTEDDDE